MLTLGLGNFPLPTRDLNESPSPQKWDQAPAGDPPCFIWSFSLSFPELPQLTKQKTHTNWGLSLGFRAGRALSLRAPCQ